MNTHISLTRLCSLNLRKVIHFLVHSAFCASLVGIHILQEDENLHTYSVYLKKIFLSSHIKGNESQESLRLILHSSVVCLFVNSEYSVRVLLIYSYQYLIGSMVNATLQKVLK